MTGGPPRVRVLPRDVAERIAAGEVIDRPASAAKELIENALDAGARRIAIEVRGGGLELLRVADDGHGVHPDDIALVFARHATSKITDLDDLTRLASLGFRGEALPSIATIAEVSLSSRTAAHEHGAGVTVRFGDVLERGTRARSPGTTVSVRDLFGNVPARRAFLGPRRAESARIGETARRYALGRPDVSFTLSFDGRPAFRTDGDGDPRRVIALLYGAGIAESLALVDQPLPGGGRVRGLVGTGGPWHSGRAHVHLFVNGRLVRQGAVATAVDRSYRPFAPAGRHPLLVLHLELSPEALDANVHPAKLEVRVAAESVVTEAIGEAVAAAFGRTPAGAGASLSLQYRMPLARRRVGEPASVGYQAGDSDAPDHFPAGLRYHATALDGVIVAEAEGALYLVDQHRAHERVLFEDLGAGEGGSPQALLEPALLRPPMAAVEERASELAGLGFVVEEFGTGALVARTVPGALGGLDPAELAGLLDAALADAAGWRDRLLATAACRAAVKKGDPLAPDAARTLLDRLVRTHSPAVCPHGSPVLVHLPAGLLGRLFRW